MALIGHFPHRPSLVASFVLAGCTAAWAQSPATQLDPVTVTARQPATANVAGWGDTPLSRAPLQASVIGAEQIKDGGAHRLAELIKLDPALSSSYNAEGYWDFLSVRGFTLDNRFNFRRDGLPINAETWIPLDNKARVEVLKGISGMQAGTSSPGGLVNYVVKRPTESALSAATLEWREQSTVSAAVDLSRRFGEGEAMGLRLNAEAGHLAPKTRNADGERQLLALAGQWRPAVATLIELESEHSRRSQPSVPGFSLLGSTVPDARSIAPRLNLNNQRWSQPVVLEGNTASLRVTQKLENEWALVAHAMTQHLRSDDRAAFPFGVYDPQTFQCDPCDRFAADGSFTMWQFVSDNERRRSNALEVSVAGPWTTGDMRHQLQAGLLRSTYRARLGPQVFDIAGTGNIAGTANTPASPGTQSPNTNRDERSSELHLRDAVRLSTDVELWLGLRYTHLQRESAGTDGSQALASSNGFSTPWAAASYTVATDLMVYASWGQGMESEVVPNQPLYSNAGQALPVSKSRQIELGLKRDAQSVQWGLAWFDIVRPVSSDIGLCNAPASCARALDGNAHHRGLEASAALRSGAWTLRGGAQWLRARRDESQLAGLNGLKPVNVPGVSVKAQGEYALAVLPGASLQGSLLRDGRRMALPNNSASIPGYTRLDAAARYEARMGEALWTWRIGVDNLADKRAWQESPYQFSHAYLFPLAPRTWRFSLEAAL